MIYTYGLTKAQFAPYVDTGKCATDPSVLVAVNEAMMRLLLCDNWRLAVQKIIFTTVHNTIVLPEFVDSIISHRTCCGIPSRVWNQWYEFAESGPGETTFNGNPGNDLIDMGYFPTFYPIEINSSLGLAAFSTVVGDIGKTIHVRGISCGRQAMTGTDLGVDLPIQRWRAGQEGSIDYDALTLSSVSFSEVTSLVKQVTAGHVSLLAIDRTTHTVQILGVYQPWEVSPGFRRYKIVNHDHVNGSTIVAACRMRYVPMRHDNDPLIIQNPPAVIAMLQSMREEKARNVNGQVAFENKAMQWLQRQSVKLDDQQAVVGVTVRDWGMADAPNFQ